MKVQQITNNKNNAPSFGISSPFKRAKAPAVIKQEVIDLQDLVKDLNESQRTNIELCKGILSKLNKNVEHIPDFKKVVKTVAESANEFFDKEAVSIFINKSNVRDRDFYVDLFKRSPLKKGGEVSGDSSFVLAFHDFKNLGWIRASMVKSHESVNNQVARNLVIRENRKEPESYSRIMRRLLFGK